MMESVGLIALGYIIAVAGAEKYSRHYCRPLSYVGRLVLP